MLKRFHEHCRYCWALIRDREFWVVFAWMSVLLGLIGGLGWFAIRNYDAFLRLTPLVCRAELDEWRFLALAALSPLCVLFTVLSLGELLALLEQRRHRIPISLRYFGLFSGAMLGSALVVLLALRC